IVEVQISRTPNFIRLDGFDRAGFHVLDAKLMPKPPPGTLYVHVLRAAHGRNVDDFNLEEGERKVPGRGNTLAVAVALEATVQAALEAGFCRIECNPGGPTVAALYERIGFRKKTEPEAGSFFDI